MRDRLALRETADLPLIAPSAPQGLRVVINGAFHAAGIRPRVEMEVNRLAMAKTLVRDGLGCMFLAQSGLRGRVDEASIGYARIHDPVISWTMSVAVRRHGQPTLAARLLMRMIESLVAGLVRDKEWHGEVLAGKR